MRDEEELPIKQLITLPLAFLFCLQPLLGIAAQENSELPKALGMYLSSKEGLIKLEEDAHFLQNFKEQVYWPEAADVTGENLSIISYSAFAALRDSEQFHLYSLAAKSDKPPYIHPSDEIALSIEPIVGVPGLIGNMVKLVPQNQLAQGNYLLTYDAIDYAETCWRFTINGGRQLLPFDMYLITKESLLSLDELSLYHEPGGRISLRGWEKQRIQDIEEQTPSIVVHATLAAENSTRFHLYRLAKEKQLKPRIETSYEIDLHVELPDALGNMVELTPDTTLTKGNYLLTEGNIFRTNRCWGFTVEGGEPLWMEIPVKGCLLASGGCLGLGALILLLLR